MCVRAKSLQLRSTLATPWTAACQAPLSMGILQPGILEWVAMPTSRDLSDPGTELCFLRWQVGTWEVQRQRRSSHEAIVQLWG